MQVAVAAPLEDVRAYLADPRNRPQWQSSLHRIEHLAVGPNGPSGVGTRWIDVTKAGVKPAMVITESAARRWVERGDWGELTAELAMDFVAVDSGTMVDIKFEIKGKGWLSALAAQVLTRLAPAAVTADVRRAAVIVEEQLSPG